MSVRLTGPSAFLTLAFAFGLIAALPTRIVAQPSAADTASRMARPFLRIELAQLFWGSDGTCDCKPVSLDVGAGVRLRHGLESLGALDLGGGIGVIPDIDFVWGLDAGLFLRPDHRMRLAGRYRRDLPGGRPRSDRYALAQAALQAYPFPAGRFTRALYLMAGYAASRRTSNSDAFGLRVLTKETRRGPLIGIGWGPR